MENKNEVTTLKLRQLLHALKDLRPDICIRFRFIGEMWQTDYSRIIELNEKGGIFEDEKTSKCYGIPDFNNLMQFEIDKRFQEYHPHFHYEVRSVVGLSEIQSTAPQV